MNGETRGAAVGCDGDNLQTRGCQQTCQGIHWVRWGCGCLDGTLFASMAHLYLNIHIVPPTFFFTILALPMPPIALLMHSHDTQDTLHNIPLHHSIGTIYCQPEHLHSLCSMLRGLLISFYEIVYFCIILISSFCMCTR